MLKLIVAGVAREEVGSAIPALMDHSSCRALGRERPGPPSLRAILAPPAPSRSRADGTGTSEGAARVCGGTLRAGSAPPIAPRPQDVRRQRARLKKLRRATSVTGRSKLARFGRRQGGAPVWRRTAGSVARTGGSAWRCACAGRSCSTTPCTTGRPPSPATSGVSSGSRGCCPTSRARWSSRPGAPTATSSARPSRSSASSASPRSRTATSTSSTRCSATTSRSSCPSSTRPPWARPASSTAGSSAVRAACGSPPSTRGG